MRRGSDVAAAPGLHRARDFLLTHHHERVTLARVAREAGLSPFHCHRAFARLFRETPHDLVTRLRIERAKRLLLVGGQSVTEICFEVGYESLGSFSARFRTLTGLAPTCFRREARRAFGAAGWPRYYIPGCFRSYFLGEQESRSISGARTVD